MKLLTWASFLRLLKNKYQPEKPGGIINSPTFGDIVPSLVHLQCFMAGSRLCNSDDTLPAKHVVFAALRTCSYCALRQATHWDFATAAPFKSFRALGRPFDPIRPCKDWSLWIKGSIFTGPDGVKDSNFGLNQSTQTMSKLTSAGKGRTATNLPWNPWSREVDVKKCLSRDRLRKRNCTLVIQFFPSESDDSWWVSFVSAKHF